MAIPHTRTRLKGYVTLKATKGGLQLAEYHVDLAQDPAMKDLVTIGAAQQMTIEQSREGNFRREFSDGTNKLDGKPAETYPGLSSFKVNLQRVELYDTNFSEAFKIRGDNPSVNVADQYKPLLLQISQPIPINDDGSDLSVDNQVFRQRTYIVPGCWFNGLTIEWNIDDDNQKYIQSVDMVARDVIIG
jgi:hypothetical protein